MFPRSNVFLFIILCIVGFVLSSTSEDLRITLSNGSKLIGRYHRSFSGRPAKAFKGIPYAKPPIGQLRFKAPEPLEKWDGEYKAVNDAPMCSQRNPFIRSFDDVGTEDCLYLNVYVPYRFGENKTLMPVLVQFHGGGFMCLGGPYYQPDYFLDHDVILVTANYRLGPLGFLSTEDESCPGNFGLKDQALVLKWIHENIKHFEGDPESVTIFGGSAGGASVTYQMASPLSKGLVHKAIAMSGTNLAPWSQPAHDGVARKRATQLANQFNCYTPNDWTKTIDCLRGIPAVNITAAFYDFFEFDTDPMVAFTPVVEPDLPGAFITEHVRDKLTENSLQIPLMTGITFDEGLLKTAAYFGIPSLFDEFMENLDIALPIAFYYDHHDSAVQKSITNKIKEFYFDNNLTEMNINVTNLFGDGWFLTAMDTYLRLRLSSKKAASTYAYLLTSRGSISYSEMFLGDPDTFYGVSHADEGLYLFPVRERMFPGTLPSKRDLEIQQAMLRMWVDFARTGNPTPDSSPLPKWDTVKRFPIDYYRIGNLNFEGKPTFGMESDGIFDDRAQFWRESGAHLLANRSNKDEL